MKRLLSNSLKCYTAAFPIERAYFGCFVCIVNPGVKQFMSLRVSRNMKIETRYLNLLFKGSNAALI